MRGISLLPKEYKKKQQALIKQERITKSLVIIGAVLFIIFAISNIWLINSKRELANLKQQNAQIQDDSFNLRAYEDMSKEVAAIKGKVAELEGKNPHWELVASKISSALPPGVHLENASYKIEGEKKQCKILCNGADNEDVSVMIANLEAMEGISDVYCSYANIVTVQEQDRIQFEIIISNIKDIKTP